MIILLIYFFISIVAYDDNAMVRQIRYKRDASALQRRTILEMIGAIKSPWIGRKVNAMYGAKNIIKYYYVNTRGTMLGMEMRKIAWQCW
jgi:hypothetical protein